MCVDGNGRKKGYVQCIESTTVAAKYERTIRQTQQGKCDMPTVVGGIMHDSTGGSIVIAKKTRFLVF